MKIVTNTNRCFQTARAANNGIPFLMQEMFLVNVSPALEIAKTEEDFYRYDIFVNTDKAIKEWRKEQPAIVKAVSSPFENNPNQEHVSSPFNPNHEHFYLVTPMTRGVFRRQRVLFRRVHEAQGRQDPILPQDRQQGVHP